MFDIHLSFTVQQEQDARDFFFDLCDYVDRRLGDDRILEMVMNHSGEHVSGDFRGRL